MELARKLLIQPAIPAQSEDSVFINLCLALFLGVLAALTWAIR
jgi:hypothetical protein